MKTRIQLANIYFVYGRLSFLTLVSFIPCIVEVKANRVRIGDFACKTTQFYTDLDPSYQSANPKDAFADNHDRAASN